MRLKKSRLVIYVILAGGLLLVVRIAFHRNGSSAMNNVQTRDPATVKYHQPVVVLPAEAIDNPAATKRHVSYMYQYYRRLAG